MESRVNQDTKEILIFGITMGAIVACAATHALPQEVLGAAFLSHIGTHGAGMLAGRAMGKGPGAGGPGAGPSDTGSPPAVSPGVPPLARAAVAGLPGLALFILAWLFFTHHRGGTS